MSDWASDYARDLQRQLNGDYERHKKETEKLRAYIDQLEQRVQKAERLLSHFVALIPVGQVVANTGSWDDVLRWFKLNIRD